MLFGLWLIQAVTSIVLPCVFAAFGYRDWSEVPGLILMLVTAGAIAIIPYWFMAGRELLTKDEGWEIPRSSGNSQPGEAISGERNRNESLPASTLPGERPEAGRVDIKPE